MQTTLGSSEAARNFSELLNNIEHSGDCYTITRKGKPVASLVPVEATQRGATLAELRTIVQALPRLDGSDVAGMVGSKADVVTPGFAG